MQVDCPKCASEAAWYSKQGPDIILRCLCGYHKVVQTTLQSITIESRVPRSDLRIPRRDTSLWVTLVTLASLEEANSVQIRERLQDLGREYTVSDVSSYLTILRTRGLVENTEVRRGQPGGSTWILTDGCSDLMGV